VGLAAWQAWRPVLGLERVLEHAFPLEREL